MIVSYPATPSRIIVLLKTLEHTILIENQKKKNERKERSFRENRKKRIIFRSNARKKKSKQKGPENLSMCCNVSGQS